ncbi:helix-turn-helix domain-containing protein [Bdellovibrio bacteriovorus]|uniref:HTH cro/C1-type domain-containing protein n=1 Tax=Bdellovibrio bacteriovorus TaxID=959 RepID=A0A1Z3N6Z8_BDEBC|nr:helix-turn-helix domain-containing protein [Bdellovibrio bacteriovorus]ASD63238.1 hypothetical protein B9G79_06480 [Bdellovibrio bacteriovorus]
MDDQIVLQLKREFARRRAKNPRYSLRSFAKSLGVSVSVVSRSLNGETVPGPRNSKIIEEALAKTAAKNS